MLIVLTLCMKCAFKSYLNKCNYIIQINYCFSIDPEFTYNEAKVLVSEETWEKEVDELVNWTNNLNTNFIDAS